MKILNGNPTEPTMIRAIRAGRVVLETIDGAIHVVPVLALSADRAEVHDESLCSGDVVAWDIARRGWRS